MSSKSLFSVISHYLDNELCLEVRASLVAQLVKNLSAMWETWVRSLGLEDPLKKGKATHSGVLAWDIPCTEEPDALQSMADLCQ